MTVPADRRKRRDAARDARQERTRGQKKVGAFRSRIEETEALARILVRKHGLDPAEARRLAFTANPLREMLGKRGQPPSGYELYEGVETCRDPKTGRLPTGRGTAFWPAFTRQWNAVNSEEHPEWQYYTADGQPDWRSLQSVYRIEKRRLEAVAAAILASPTPKP